MNPPRLHAARALALASVILLLGACAARPRPVARTPAPAVPPPPPHAPPARASSTPAPSMLPAMDARTRLVQSINAFIHQPRFAHARWGIEVRDLDTGRTLVAHDANKLFIPASNAKLYTASLALHVLGPDYRFHTTLYATRHPDGHGVLKGDLILYGRGDPGLGMDADGKPSDAWADQLAASLAQRGVRSVSGNLIADATWYAGPDYGAGWEIDDDLGGYAPPVSALSVQDNAFRLELGGDGTCCSVHTEPADTGIDIINTLSRSIDGVYDPLGLYRPPGSDRLYVFGSRPATRYPRVFSLAMPDPPRYAAQVLVEALARHGIGFHGSIQVRRWPHTDSPARHRRMLRITDVRSAPLHVLIHHMLKKSDNLYAQLLLLAVGKQQQAIGECVDRQHPPTLTAGWGLCALRAWLHSIGIDRASTQFEEGSGLSRKDRVTPNATVKLLAWIRRQGFASDLVTALPIAGVDGTLKDRLRGTLAAGNLRAKTGTLHLAYTLSGYVRAANGHRLGFSIMLNAYAVPRAPDGTPAAESPPQDIDAIARMLARYGQVPLEPQPGTTAPAPTSTARTPDAPAGPGTSAARKDPPPA